jgi:hypothetical protein
MRDECRNINPELPMGRQLGDTEQDLFTPLRPAKGTKLVLAAVIGPVAWVIAWLVAAWLIRKSDAIEFGLLITLGSFVFAAPVLGLLAWGRAREERRFQQTGRRLDDRA